MARNNSRRVKVNSGYLKGNVMVSQEFKQVVSSQNVLRARIMLKDSLLIDPTFHQFDEMLRYATKENLLPGLIDDHDGFEFEDDDKSKWTEDLMNEELVQIVNNFSYERIAHLKKVVSNVLESKAKMINDSSRRTKGINVTVKNSTRANDSVKKPAGVNDSIKPKSPSPNVLLETLKKEASIITRTMSNTDKSFSTDDIFKLEGAALSILNAIHEYRVSKRVNTNGNNK